MCIIFEGRFAMKKIYLVLVIYVFLILDNFKRRAFSVMIWFQSTCIEIGLILGAETLRSLLAGKRSFLFSLIWTLL